MEDEEYKGYDIRIEPDHDSESPRDWDNVGTMACWHGRYSLGDVQPKVRPTEFRMALAREIVGKEISDDQINIHRVILDNYITRPLYLLDHSGITMNTTGFSCPWDSMQVGFIYVKKGFEGMSDEKLGKHLQSEVETYDTYIRGDVVGFIVEKDGEHIDSCWGYYTTEDAVSEAKSIIDGEIKWIAS